MMPDMPQSSSSQSGYLSFSSYARVSKGKGDRNKKKEEENAFLPPHAYDDNDNKSATRTLAGSLLI